MEITRILSELCTLCAPSGYERELGRRVAELMEPLCDGVSRDRLGNVHGVRRAKGAGAPKILMSAHMDEIGFMVTKLEEGFLRFRSIGGVDPRVLPAREVTVLCDPPLHGVISSIPPHLQTAEESKKAMEQDDLCIDIGFSREEAEKRVKVGSLAVFSERCLPLGERLFSGKALDDRACVVMLLRVLELLEGKEIDAELIIQASVQEEVGARGAQTGGYAEAPDYAIAVDVCHAETPDGQKDRTLKQGAGVPVSLGPNTNRRLANKLIELCGTHNLGYQPEVMEGKSGTDANTMQVAALGTATVIISLPLKYMHTAVEVINLDDLEAGAKLLSEFVLSFSS
ncbi:MAG: M20/M25/M40 family metallo-hydrolase [Oscillospiraceae bacterium]|jgi:endoglucanase|nr:M20/M25/M40 family metallo-hydrolase [Oscillospiraceae bacterium]